MNRMRPSRPSLEATRALSPTERLAFELADFSSRYLTTPAKAWNSALMGVTLWATTGRRTDIVGLEHLSTFGPRDRVLFVCNHRSFFDFFVITATCFWRTKLSRRILFPIRSTFFYDHPLGPVVNGAMSAMSMFPPFLRDKGEARRAFNRWAVDRCVGHVNQCQQVSTVSTYEKHALTRKASGSQLPARRGPQEGPVDCSISRLSRIAAWP